MRSPATSRPRADTSSCFEADPRYELEERYWVNSAGGLWTADSPFLAAEVYGLFGDLGLTGLAREYMKEQPVLSVQKGTLRKVSRDNDVVRSIVSQGAGGGWHQDGQFLGSVKALNVWISLSRCGDVSPGMDLVPRRLEEIVATGTEGAPLDWTVADDVAREVAGDRGIARPIFNPGDALMFDEMFLHTTAIEETMSEPRYAIETWFFGSSAFPAGVRAHRALAPRALQPDRPQSHAPSRHRGARCEQGIRDTGSQDRLAEGTLGPPVRAHGVSAARGPAAGVVRGPEG